MGHTGGALRNNRRSFDCVSRDEAARDFAQDDTSGAGLEVFGGEDFLLAIETPAVAGE
jgi:hypothetical protein